MLVAGVLGASSREGFDCNTLTTNACGRSAWCKQPRGIWLQRSNHKCLWPEWLANGRLERLNNRGLWRQWRQTALIEATNACGQSAWSKFHTCGGPKHRPCLGEGRGRRTYATYGYNHDNDDFLGRYNIQSHVSYYYYHYHYHYHHHYYCYYYYCYYYYCYYYYHYMCKLSVNTHTVWQCLYVDRSWSRSEWRTRSSSCRRPWGSTNGCRS